MDYLRFPIFVTQTELPIHAPAAGIIEELLVADGAKVEANAQLFKLRITGKLCGVLH